MGFRRLSPPNMKISEFSTSRSAIAVAMVVLKRMLPQSENAVLVVMIVERFWLWRGGGKGGWGGGGKGAGGRR